MKTLLVITVLLIAVFCANYSCAGLSSRRRPERGGRGRKRGKNRKEVGQDPENFKTQLYKILETYDNEEPPPGPGPSRIRVGMYINQMALTDEGTMKLVFYMRQAWKDKRLAGKGRFPAGEKVRLVGERYKQIWRPDLFFRNAIRAVRRENAMTMEQLTRVNATGHIWDVMTINGEFNCPELIKDDRNFTCPMTIESYGNTMDTIVLGWLDSAVDVDLRIELKQHTLTDIILHDCSQNYTAGAFPCHEVRFKFRGN